MHPRIKNALIGTTIAACLASGLAAGCSKEYPVNPETIPISTPESTYGIALKKLDYQTSEYWKGVARDYNSEQAIDELYFMPEKGRLVMADDIGKYTSDKIISDIELNDMADPDRDGIKSSKEYKNGTNPMDPSNSTKTIKPETFNYVRDLVKYRDSISDDRTLPDIYQGLSQAIYAIEKQPKIVKSFDIYGADFLAQFLSNKDVEEALQYWRGVNALGLQAEMNFYTMNAQKINIGHLTGMSTNFKYDPDEKEIVDKIWKNRVLWQQKGEVLIPMDDSIMDLWKDENVQTNNLRQSLMPGAIFHDDIVTGKPSPYPESGIHDLYNSYDTNTWLEVAQYNLSHLQSTHDEFWNMINDPNYKNKYGEDLLELHKFSTHNTSQVEAKYKEYLDIAFEEGKPHDLALMKLSGYARIYKPGTHEIYVPAASLYAWSIGGAIYSVTGTIPPTGDAFDNKPDGNVGIPISDSLYEALRREGNPIIEKNTNAWPQRFGADREILEKCGVKWVVVYRTNTIDGIEVLFGGYSIN